MTNPAADPEPDGVWGIIDDLDRNVLSVFPDEVSALRAAVARGFCTVRFIEYGKEL